jgi:fatty acid desaturase
MNMLEGLADLQGNALSKVLRRTVLSALAVGLVAVIVALLLSAPWVALGLAVGLGLAVVNLRFLDSGVAKLHTEGEPDNKVLRRAMGTKSVTRLGIITVICVGLMLLEGGLGIGAVAGLVIFQLLFVLNVGRVVMSQGIQ